MDPLTYAPIVVAFLLGYSFGSLRELNRHIKYLNRAIEQKEGGPCWVKGQLPPGTG